MFVALATLLLPAGARAQTVLAQMTEDFSTGWTNNVDGNLGDGASRNGWTFRNGAAWTYATNFGDPSPSIKSLSSRFTEIYAAKNHDLGTAGLTNFTYLLRGAVATEQNQKLGQVLLSDSNGNGYYIRYYSSFPSLTMQVFETSGGTRPVTSNLLPNYSEVSLGSSLFAPYTLNTFYTMNLALSQAGPGQAFTIDAWVDGYGSAELPLLSFTNTNSSGLDLADLTSVAFTARDFTYLDNIEVQLIPEPSTVALLVLGGAGVLIARRRWR